MRKEFKDYYIELGFNIAYYRKINGFTQEQLSEIIGIEQPHLSKIEVARVGVSLDTLFAICDALKITPDKLFRFRNLE